LVFPNEKRRGEKPACVSRLQLAGATKGKTMHETANSNLKTFGRQLSFRSFSLILFEYIHLLREIVKHIARKNRYL
jgi:hypothetical protein